MKKCKFLGLILTVFASVFCLPIISCGNKAIGYGILLWSPDEKIVATGSILPVIKESGIEETYTLLLGNDKTYEVPRWRVRFFKKEKAAEAYRDKHKPLLETIGVTNIDGLRIRTKPDSSAQPVYKLRKLETVKLLERSATKAEEGSYEDYWYKVLTENGTSGWCFGHTLMLREIGEEADETLVREEDPYLSKLLSNVWRPEYFITSIRTERIDLDEFRSSVGLFPRPEEKKIILNTKDTSRVFEYSRIVPVRQGVYLFEGTSLRIHMMNIERLNTEYREKEKYVKDTYVIIDEGIEKIIKKERQRRSDIYSSLVSAGSHLESDNYGTITIESYSKFIWEEYWRLVPDVIPSGAGTAGKIDFNLFLPGELEKKHDGAVSFTFLKKKEKPVVFLFSRTDGGIRFVYVPQENIRGSLIEKEPAFPIIIFFTARE
jgi:hypothetical protein